MNRSFFLERSFCFTKIVEADTLMCGKELIFYIETPIKLLKRFKNISDMVLYLERDMEELKVTSRILHIYSCFTVNIINMCCRM